MEDDINKLRVFQMRIRCLLLKISSIHDNKTREHGRRSMGGQGDMSPVLFEAQCFVPPTFLGVGIVCYLKNSYFNSNTMHRCSLQQFSRNFSQLILRKIIKIVATRCQILRLKCTKFDFSWGSAPDPAGGAYSAPPDTLAGFKGLLLRGESRREGRAYL